MIKKTLKRIFLLLMCMYWVRRLILLYKRKAIVKLENLKNFEFACGENINLLKENNIGIIYMGRFGKVKHNFVCIDRRCFFKHIKEINSISFIKSSRSNFFTNKLNIWLLRIGIRKSGYIDIYKKFINKNLIEIFGKKESVRIYFPKKKENIYTLPNVNPVLREFDLEKEQICLINVGNITFETFDRFRQYILYDQIKDKKIDLVYTWVDGFDVGWIEKKERYTGTVDSTLHHSSAISANRFEHINELLFSIRSVFMYTNFVRNIYIVTDQQLPSWLCSQEKVIVIDHKDIFPDTNVLPTFNSHSIETCLHKIKGLSEYYLYLNDDMLFGASVTLGEFFTENFYPKINYSNWAFIPSGESNSDDLPVDSAAKNARSFFQREESVFITRKFKHVPCPVNKALIQELEATMGDLVINTRKARFRTYQDISFVNCAYYHWAQIKGKFANGRLGYSYFDINKLYDSVRLLMRLCNSPDNRWHTYCLNDVDGGVNPRSRKLVKKALELHYSNPSRAEYIG